MYDPLASTSSAAGWGGTADSEQSSWPSTPHPNSPIPTLRRAVTPTSPVKEPTPGLYGREPQIYGQAEPGLISPSFNTSSSGRTYERDEGYLRVRITGIDRNRRDILIKFDAQTNLTNFTGTTYRNVSRSYLEFQQFYEAAVQSNPQTIIPALPLAQTSAPTDEEDDRLVRIMLQRWITRVCEDPILLSDEDLRSFIESDFGYQPTPRPRRRTSSGFGIMRRGVPDEDEELQRARFELTKLEGQFFETAKAIDKLAIARKALAVTHAEMGNKLINVATTEAHPPLGNAMRKLGRTWHSLADLDQAQAISECVIIGDSLGYQGLNARSAKETLLMRTGVLEEYQAAVKTTISKRRTIERLKASSNIRPDKVDEAIEDMEEANKYEQVLATRADGISQNLHRALETHNRYANDDITTALIEHARSSIMYERQLLKELEALRVDISNADREHVPPANGAPRPMVVPPLEEYNRPMPPPTQPSNANGHGGPIHHQSPSAATLGPNSSNPSIPPNNIDPLSPHPHGPPSVSSTTAVFSRAETPVSPITGSLAPSPAPGPQQSRMIPAQPPLSPHQPPLIARLDGTKSMFISPSKPASPPATQKPPAASVASISPTPHLDPLSGGSLVQTQAPQARVDPLASQPLGDPLSAPSHTRFASQAPQAMSSSSTLDPLGGLPSSSMTSSMRVQPPGRPRLDARDAARKLANSGF
ncbi:vacuolar protein sorting-associated protein vps17 [Flagelloscypha sp. PMI_526]|nr:vacuolar protein sorting-associated protein vps17 [Flagelloscypha sp. PMI_526]